MPRSQEARSNIPTRIYALQLLTTWLFSLTIIILASFVASANSAAYDTSKRGCPTASTSFRPNIVASKEEAELKVLVPNITSFRQFVNCSDPNNVSGFCIDVFETALSIVNTFSTSSTLSPNISIHYTCFNFSSSPNASGPTYDSMVEMVANGSFDVVVGDVTIGAHRSSMVDFTHKYMESGVIILAKVVQEEFSPWLFFGFPFSLRLWCTIVGSFILTGFLICYLERNDHLEFTQGPISQRLTNIVWFTIEALVLLERDSLRSGVARAVMLAWLFFVVLLTASYTAGLSSFLTVNNLSSPSQDLLSLKDSNQSIGYRRGSIVHDYLTQRFHIPERNLVPIRMVPDFISNLTKGPHHGGVSAIVDERPYANLILATLSSSTCDFRIAGPQLTQEGFGFVSMFRHSIMQAFDRKCACNKRNEDTKISICELSIENIHFKILDYVANISNPSRSGVKGLHISAVQMTCITSRNASSACLDGRHISRQQSQKSRLSTIYHLLPTQHHAQYHNQATTQ